MTGAADDAVPEGSVDPPRWVDGTGGEHLAELLLAAKQEAPTAAQRAAMAQRLGLPLTGAAASPFLLKVVTTGLVVVAGAAAVGWLLASARSPDSTAGRAHPSAPSPLPGGSVRRPGEDAGPPRQAPAEAGLLERERSGDVGAGEGERRSDSPADSSREDLEALPHDQPTLRAAGSSVSGVPGAAAHRPSEVSLVRAARGALSSDPRKALSLTRTHRQLYPSGVLSQEREVIAIEALRALGRDREASEKAESFRAAHPESGHRPVGE